MESERTVAHPSPSRDEGAHRRDGDLAVDLDEPARLQAAERLVPPYPGNTTLDSLCALASMLLGTRSAQVSLLTDVQHVPSGTGLPQGTLESPSPRAESLCTVTTSSGHPVVVADAPGDSRVNRLPPVTSGQVGCYLGVPLRSHDGEVVGALCAYDPGTHDWQDRDVVVLEELAFAVIAELERVALASEHATVLLRLDLAMDAAGVGSWDWDLDSGELLWDDRLKAMFGYSAGEFDNSIDAFNRRIHREDLQRVTEALEAAIRGDAEYDETYRVVLPDATLRWVSARGRALRDESGEVVRIVGAATDVTERLIAEQEASRMLELLELVATASRVLADSLEVEHAVRSLARLVVPALAEWSIVTLIAPDGSLRDVDSWHQDPELRPATALLGAHWMDGGADAGAMQQVISGRQPMFLDSGLAARADEVLRSDIAKVAARQMSLESVGILPLIAKDMVVGALTLGRGPDRPPLTETEAATALEVAERASTALDHARSFDRVRDISEQLQRSMLEEPVQPEGLDIAVRYTPASKAAQVGGDWYDSFVQPDGATMLVVGDVIGHDSAAAAAMGQLRSLMRGIAYAAGGSPAAVLTRVGQAMQGLGVDTIATSIVAQLVRDPVTGTTRMSWSNGGHPPAVVLHPDGSTRLLEDHGMLLGLVEEEHRADHTLDLEPGSVVLLFTDGLVERRGQSLADGFERLRAVLQGCRGMSVGDLVTRVHRELVPAAPEDDVAVLAVKIADPRENPTPPAR
jgi:PAS domain S-box-containing protein